jgi:DNA polymerase-3 subunit epsilon
VTKETTESVAHAPTALETRLASGWQPRAFVAIDFETANRNPSSACAVSVVRVEGTRITEKSVSLIRPPTSQFEFSHVHGITWADVAAKSAFCEVWKSLAPLIEGAEFLAAHNAKFDRDVLAACCRNALIAIPKHPFVCTVALARLRWNLYPTKLPNVCEFLGLPLRHHDPLSDASACAGIVLAAGSGTPPSKVIR